jgi:putative two-component system response regulator
MNMAVAVLLVDANPRSSADWGALLSDQGYDVITAPNGAAALALCASFQPDLVLLFDLLPDMSGLEVCRRLKANPRNRLTPIIFHAATGDFSDASSAFHAGATDFWGRSPSPWEALSRLHALLQLKTYVDEQAESVLISLAQSIEARDPFESTHCARVSNNAVRFGKSLGLGQSELEALRIAGLIHDIGKIGIPDTILCKSGPLDPDESAIVMQHPIVGEEICAPLKSLRHVLPLVRHHHERLDGSGYPDGLQGEQIPFLVRALQIVDICDALTSDRSYRRNLSLPSALTVLYEEADRGWLDAELVSQFASLVVGAEGSIALGNRRGLGSAERAGCSPRSPARRLGHHAS